MNGTILQIYICVQFKTFIIFVNNKGINIFKTISLNGQKTSKITASNLKYKNLISELGNFFTGEIKWK